MKLEDARFTVYEDEREMIVTFVSVYCLQIAKMIK